MRPTLLALLLATPATADPSYPLPSGETVAPLEMFQECTACPEMIVLPMGRFTMGAPLEESAYLYSLWHKTKPGDPVGFASEGPQHEVTIDIPFAMGRHEVTREEWAACFDGGGCSHDPDPRIPQLSGYLLSDHPRSPIMNVSYQDMLEYVAWLNEVTGTGAYRLPTEAEWEYAARAGTTTRFAQGDILTREQANIAVVVDKETGQLDPSGPFQSVPVDMLDAANGWGLRHIAGNIREQTSSCWSDRHLDLQTSSTYLDAVEPVGVCERVIKDGSYQGTQDYSRPAMRGPLRDDRRAVYLGFRVVREM